MKTHCMVDDTEIDSSQCLECRCKLAACGEKRAFFEELKENGLDKKE